MNLIEEMTVQPLVQSLGWTLLHFVWQGSLVATAFAAVNAMLRQRNASVRYVTASTAMLVMTACVPVTFYLIYSSQPVSPGVGVEPASSFEIPELLRPLDGDSQRTIHIPPADGSGGVLNGQSPSGQAVTSIATYTARDRLRSLLPWIVGCWVTGVLVLSMRLLGGWAYMRILVRRRSRAASEQWCDTVDLLRKRLGIDRTIQLLETASVEVPVVFGWLRPALLLPVTAFTGLSPDQVEAVLIHELAHIRRHDYLVNLLQTVAETLLFYHPAIWWISRRMRVEREYCCDDIASSQSKDTLTYVTALSQLEERRGVALNLAVAAAGGSLLERIRRLCNVTTPGSSARRPGLLGLLVVVALVTAVASYTSQDSDNASADAESSTPAQTEGAVETQFTSNSTDEVDPDWSPDGGWIAFASTQSGNSDIWIKPVVGGEATRITRDPASDRVPRWSPDGSTLLFASDRSGALNLWTISPFEGEETLRQITSDADVLALEGQGSWSPDGTEIVFGSDRDGNYDLWIISAAGGASRQLTNHPRDEWAADWSPDGKWIAFNAGDRRGTADLWIIPSEGGTARQLTDQQNYGPSWSPDGKWIAYCSEGGPAANQRRMSLGHWDIWLLPSSGGIPFKLIDTRDQDAAGARWSPDGTKIAYNQRVRRGIEYEADHDVWIADVGGMMAVAGQMAHQRIAGRVTLNGKPGADVLLRVKDGNGKVQHTATPSEDGRYQVWVEPGSYTVSVVRAEGADPIEVTLKAGEQMEDIDFAARPIRPPKELVRAAAAYRELRGYRDSTTVVVFEERPGEETKRTTWTKIAFERPNKVRLETTAQGQERVTVSDGLMLTDYLDARWMGGQTQYTQKKAPEKAIAAGLQRPMGGPGGGVLFSILTNDEPLGKLTADLERVEKVGHEELDGEPVAVVELTVPASSLSELKVPYASRVDAAIEMRLWIDENDYLIRQLAFELDLKRMVEEVPEEHRAWMPTRMALTERHTAIQVDPGFAEDTFVFVPPEAAELVDQFGPPGPSRDKSEFVGKPAPEFALKDIDNNQVALADFEGQVLILDFWATWCGPCRREMPTFVALQDQYDADGFSVIGLTIRDTVEKVRAYASDEELNFPLLMADDKVRKDYGNVSALPTTFVIDKQGIVRYTYVGSPHDLLVFQQHVEELLAESL